MTKNIWITFIAFLCLAGIFSSCGKDLPAEYNLSIDERVEFDNNWYLKLLDILEDSRCPLNAVCIWEGRAVTQFELSSKLGSIDTFLLSVGAKTNVPYDTLLHGFKFDLLKVDPQPDINIEINLEDYVVLIRVDSTD